MDTDSTYLTDHSILLLPEHYIQKGREFFEPIGDGQAEIDKLENRIEIQDGLYTRRIPDRRNEDRRINRFTFLGCKPVSP